MTYHLSSEQYQRGVDYIAEFRVKSVCNGRPLGRTAGVLGMAELLARLANTSAAKVMRDSDARLADLDSPLTLLPGQS